MIAVRVRYLMVRVVLNGIHTAVRLTTYGSANQAEMEETLRDWLCWGEIQPERAAPVLPLPSTGRIPPLLGGSHVATTLLIKCSPIMGHRCSESSSNCLPIFCPFSFT